MREATSAKAVADYESAMRLDDRDSEYVYRRAIVFQVDIVRPINGGAGPALDIAAELNTQFPMNGRYTSGAVTVQVISPASAGPGLQEENAYVVPVSLEYRADVI